jgi:chromosome segregation protein
LPQQVADLDAACSAAQAALTAERGRQQQLAAERLAVEGNLRALSAVRSAEAAQDLTLRQQAARLDQEIRWAASMRQQAQAELAALDKKEGDLQATLSATEERRSTVVALVASLQSRAASLSADLPQARAAELRTEARLSEQALRGQRAVLADHQAGSARLIQQLAGKRARLAELSSEAEELGTRLEGAQRDLAALGERTAALQARIAPSEMQLSALEARQSELTEQEALVRSRLLDGERLAARSSVEVSRAQEELIKLQAQIEAEEVLRVGSPPEPGDSAGDGPRLPGLADLPRQLRFELNGPPGRLAPLVDMQTSPLPPEQVKRQVDRLRGQIRALGAVNPNAMSEYEESRQRHAFLSTQADDLQEASKALKTVVGELDALMKKRFTETFRAVAEEFKRYFSVLFAGGTARLVLTDPDDATLTGIEIVAQPPGKRLQSLALLSGGERALTATALLFAILAVNPTPFCVLDEVDAALDEANIGRFTQVLKGLAERTQFVIITHNRGTMETSKALYGVSMADDGASRVISLKLEGA